MKVLLVVDYNPEYLKFYSIEDPTEEQLAVLEAVNGKYSGSDDQTDEMNIVSIALSSTPPCWESEVDSKWGCIWGDKEVTTPIQGPFEKVFLFGVCL
jgi:hypothetical protein